MKTASLVALLALLPAAQSAPWQQPADWTAPIDPFSIADELHYVGSEGLSAFLLTGEEGHVLIDAPLEENVPRVLDNIRTLGFDPADVRILLASHAHFDHVGGLAAMREATGAEVVLSVRDARQVAVGGRGDYIVGDEAPYPAVVADRTIGHLERVTLGSLELTAHLTPGHTPGCTSWSGTVHIAGEPVRFVSVCSLSVLSGAVLAGEAPSYPGIARDYCASARHLATLTPDVFLAPHGSFFGMEGKVAALAAGDRRAFVDPDRYRAYLERATGAIEATLAEQGEPGGCAAVLADDAR